ncbi:N-acetyltransferase family protein [Phenylobacterium sp.]|uniref:GNAT family N-acetyltransferase n=1 Tax=Phenylobacterium sp. TaxID=1871053 RepID=UPI0035AF2FAA
MFAAAELRIDRLEAPPSEADTEALAKVLHACVHAGASVGFILPFELADARRFWAEAVLPSLARGGRRLFIARLDGEAVGTVQLCLETMPNQAHRADVSKLLVHPKARRRGIARALMLALEAAALDEGRSLLTLDTRSGDAAEPLYLSLGYELAGRYPGYARAPDVNELEATSLMFKALAAA